MKDNNGQGDPGLLGPRVAIPSKVWAGASAAPYDTTQGGNFDYRARDTPKGYLRGRVLDQ